jgi:hypothetical protein
MSTSLELELGKIKLRTLVSLRAAMPSIEDVLTLRPEWSVVNKSGKAKSKFDEI